METTRLSSKGQIIIPKEVRARRHWKPGQEFDVLETEEGVLLRPHPPFPPTQFEEVGGFLNYRGPAIPVERLNLDRIAYSDPYEQEDDDRT